MNECYTPTQWMTLKQLLNLDEMQKFHTGLAAAKQKTNKWDNGATKICASNGVDKAAGALMCVKKSDWKKQQKGDHSHLFVLAML